MYGDGLNNTSNVRAT